MHISIPEDVKKQFHAVCVLRGRRMNYVVVELVKQWLVSEAHSLSELKG